MKRIFLKYAMIGALLSGAGVALEAGTISGRVTDSTTGEGIAGLGVGISDANCDSVGEGLTDSSGGYETSTLPTGTYYAGIWDGNQRYAWENWDDIPCYAGCPCTWGTPIEVNASSETSGIDFALEPGGTISGRVTNAATGLPLEDVRVDVWVPGPDPHLPGWIGRSTSDDSGDYTLCCLPAGSYYVKTWGAPETTLEWVVDQLYEGVVCYAQQCLFPPQGTLVPVTAGSDTPGIDFALELGGTISGRVSDDIGPGSPIPDSWLAIHDSEGDFLMWYPLSWEGDGASYSIWTGFPEGSYLALAGAPGYVTELYDDVPCSGWCDDFSLATPIQVTAGEKTEDISFRLELEPSFGEFAIDIKPGSYPNCFNSNGHGVIPVAILGSDTFDVAIVDTSTLAFDGSAVRIKGNGAPQCGLEDVSGDFSVPEGMPDGYLDLVCQFVDEGGFVSGEGEASVTGELFDGTGIIGTDSICVVP